MSSIEPRAIGVSSDTDLSYSVQSKRISSHQPAGYSVTAGLASGLELTYPLWTKLSGAWLGHIPFAFWLIEAARPQKLVELGVHAGNAYCAMLQAIQLLRLQAQCFGVGCGSENESTDTEEVFDELRAYHDRTYGSYSTLIRSPLEVPDFRDGSVDLLHIDNSPTYEFVRQQFAAWQPKLSPRAVVLLHDTNVRNPGSGVSSFFQEISPNYPTFEFLHSKGLGVVYAGSEPLDGPLHSFFSATGSDVGRIRTYFARLGASVLDHHEAAKVSLLEQELLAARVAHQAAERALQLQRSVVAALQRDAIRKLTAASKAKKRDMGIRALVNALLAALAQRLRAFAR